MMNRFPTKARSVRHALRVLALTACCTLLGPVQAQANPPPALPESAGGVAQFGPAQAAKVLSAVVRIDTRVPRDALSAATLGASRSGSGIFIRSQLVLTIGYLLLEADDVMVTTSSGRKIPGSVAGYDHQTGFGLIRTALPHDGEVLALGDSDRLAERQRVLTIGQGENGVTELFIVSRRLFTGGWEYLLDRPFYTFPPVNNWSGSALLSEDGQLVGVGSLVVNDAAEFQRGVPGNLFVPINLLKPILDDLVARGRRAGVVQPWLGLSTEMVRSNLIVSRVTPGSPADQAGLESGDVIIGVGGGRVTDQADFYRQVWKLGPAGVDVPVRLIRSGEVRTFVLKSIDRMDLIRKPGGI